MKGLFARTRRERNGGVDGLNLFFGALLGANLGTFDEVKLSHYILIIAILAVTVVALRMVSAADRRGPVLAMLGTYLAMLFAFAALPHLHPDGLRPGDIHKLVATMAVWVLLSLVLELTPASDERPPPDVRGEDEAGETP
ncbi:MAG TPA: hypothetical protein VGB08_11945 [Allosphingosinicella sp.]|jgi:hypothetical protein